MKILFSGTRGSVYRYKGLRREKKQQCWVYPMQSIYYCALDCASELQTYFAKHSTPYI